MDLIQTTRIESETLPDFVRVMQQDERIRPRSQQHPLTGGARLDLNPDSVKNGLGQLVLTLVKLLHEVLEKQALRRIDAGDLTDDQIEQLGLTMMRQAEEIDRLRTVFGLGEDDLNLDLGPLGKLF
jgi:hypothetical protein